MMLRGVVLGCALLFAVLSAVETAWDFTAWPMLAMACVLLTGTVFERAHYRGNATADAPDGWRKTEERFIDDATGRPITVWFNEITGERRYEGD